MGQLHHKSVQHDADCLLSCNVSSYVPPTCPRNTDATSVYIYDNAMCLCLHTSEPVQDATALAVFLLLFLHCHTLCRDATDISTVNWSERQLRIDMHNGTEEQPTVTCVSVARRGD